MAAPHYVAGIDFDPAVRQDAFDVMARLIEHYRNKSTDRAPEQWREPARNYRDQDQWRQEIQAVFKKVPLPLALTCELPGPGTGKANRLTCPYHAWSYDLKGCLVGVYGEETFGGVDRDTRSLFALPAAE